VATNALPETQISIHPNPVSDHFEITGIPKMNTTISLHDFQGRILRIWDSPYGELKLEDIPSGHYVLTIQSEEKLVNQKVIKH